MTLYVWPLTQINTAGLATDTNQATQITIANTTNTKLDTALTRLSGSFVNVAYDYMSYTSGASTDTYVFNTGGAGGTTVKTLTITYADSTKAVISNVAAV
jgi:hypothetical protein